MFAAGKLLKKLIERGDCLVEMSLLKLAVPEHRKGLVALIEFGIVQDAMKLLDRRGEILEPVVADGQCVSGGGGLGVLRVLVEKIVVFGNGELVEPARIEAVGGEEFFCRRIDLLVLLPLRRRLAGLRGSGPDKRAQHEGRPTSASPPPPHPLRAIHQRLLAKCATGSNAQPRNV